MDTITVRTIPLDPISTWLDCTVCGDLGTCPPDDAHGLATRHLQGHGFNIDHLEQEHHG